MFQNIFGLDLRYFLWFVLHKQGIGILSSFPPQSELIIFVYKMRVISITLFLPSNFLNCIFQFPGRYKTFQEVNVKYEFQY